MTSKILPRRRRKPSPAIVARNKAIVRDILKGMDTQAVADKYGVSTGVVYVAYSNARKGTADQC